jgi:hypothetical protein
MGLFRSLTVLLLALVIGLSAVSASSAMIVDPPGNRHAKQPPIPRGSFLRTWELKSSFQSKYEKIRDLLATDSRLRTKIRKTATVYGIDPIHIVGALVGEHTYNVDVYDRLQAYYIKAIAYADHNFKFKYKGETVGAFIKRPQFASCADRHGSWDLWSCRDRVWEAQFRGRTVGGESFPDKRFSAVFFQPFYAGQTFGLGQVNPLTALKLTDMVHRVSGYERLDYRDAAEVNNAIMEQDVSLAYVAAAIREAIDAYRDIAGVDISHNPGITATLYNVGSADVRAARLARENRHRAAKGLSPKLPEENYYGWLVNDKLKELEAIFSRG